MEQDKKGIFPLSPTLRDQLISLTLLIGDMAVIGFSCWLAYQTRFKWVFYPNVLDSSYYLRITLIVIPLWLIVNWSKQLYSPRILFGGVEEYARVFSAGTIGTLTLVVVDFILIREGGISRGWLVLVWAFSISLLEIYRFSYRRWIYYLRSHGHLLTQSVIVCADEEGLILYQHLKHWRKSGLRVAGFIDDNHPEGQAVQNGITVLGPVSELNQIIDTQGIKEVIVATASIPRVQLIEIYRTISKRRGVKLRFSSGMFEIISTGLYIKELASVPLIEVSKTRIIGLNVVLKTLMDYVGALLALVVLSPVFIIIAFLIRLDSKGPIFYRHRVLGLNDEQFDAFKFRTMVDNGDEILHANPELKQKFELNYKLKDDPRVTKVGVFLRKFSLDELPQFINVLRGQMSIVGPRFITPVEMEKYGRWGMNLLTVKPGITGLWQVSGRSDVTYEERIRLDMYYIRSWTLWLDLQILLQTIPAVIKSRGAY